MRKLLFTSILCIGCVGFSAPAFSTPMTVTNDSTVAPKVTTAAAEDEAIATQVKEAFRKDPALQKDLGKVTVTVKDKEVTLTGIVANKAASAHFEDVASKVPNVSDVENDLEVAQ